MADIYLYVPCNGTKYYTSPNVASSTFAIYGADSLPSKKSEGRIYTTYSGKALIIKNDTNSRLSWDYTLEWWQRNASSVSTNNSMMISAGSDNPKLQLHDRVSGSTLLKFENKFGSGTSTYNYEPAGTVAMVDNLSWTHIAYVLDSTNCKAYCFINGVPQASGTFTAHSADQLYMLCVGGKSSSLTSASEFFEGDLSDVILYNGVKYQENETFTPPTNSPDTTGLIAYGQESYTYIPKIQLFTENGQYKIYKFGRGGKALPAPKSYVRAIDRYGNVLRSFEDANLNLVNKKQSSIQVFATSPSNVYCANMSSQDFSIALISGETSVAYTNGRSLLRTDGSIASYTNVNGRASKNSDSSTITGAPTFKSILSSQHGSVDVEGIGTDNIAYKRDSSSNTFVNMGPSNMSWDNITAVGYSGGTSGYYIIASDMSNNLYLFGISDTTTTPIYLMSYNTNYVASWGGVGSSSKYPGLFIADGKLYDVYCPTDGTFAVELLDDTQIWVDCNTYSGYGLALTSDGKLYTFDKDWFDQRIFARFGSETGWTHLAGGLNLFPVLKDGDIYLLTLTTGSPNVWTSERLTYTGTYTDIAGGFLARSSYSNYVALVQEIV